MIPTNPELKLLFNELLTTNKEFQNIISDLSKSMPQAVNMSTKAVMAYSLYYAFDSQMFFCFLLALQLANITEFIKAPYRWIAVSIPLAIGISSFISAKKMASTGKNNFDDLYTYFERYYSIIVPKIS